MLTLAFAFLFVAACLAVARTRGWAPLLALGFVMFGFANRTVSVAFLDLAGPVWSVQLDRYIGGGTATPAFVASLLPFLLIAWLLFEPSGLRRAIRPAPSAPPAPRPAGGGLRRADAPFVLFAGYVAILYLDMLARGVVPLFAGMERYEYTDGVAGPFHRFLFEYLFLFAFLLGHAFVRPRIRGGTYDRRLLWLLPALFVYFALTGHRVSAFFTTTAFFLIPCAAIAIAARAGRLAPPPDDPRHDRFLRRMRAVAPIGAVAFAALITGSVVNSLTNVRAYDNPVEAFVQRSLVQPAELWTVTWEDTILTGEIDNSLAWHLMFDEPLDEARNTGIQYLMVRQLGFGRTTDLLELGEQHAGGYPEIFFELFGVALTPVLIVLFSFAFIWLIRLAVIAVANGWVGTAFFAVFVGYGFSLAFISGMLNFLIVPTFWAKCAALIAFLVVESRRPDLQGRPVHVS